MSPSTRTIKIQKTMSLRKTSMEDLPIEVMVDILSRLPVKTIIHCKCVCKKWRNIVLDSYFADLQLSRSPAGIMIHQNSKKEMNGDRKPGILNWVEVEDELDHHHLHHDPLMSLDLNLAHILQDSSIDLVGSVNGLICLWQFGSKIDNTCICNPITREYMILPRQQCYGEAYGYIVYCFGIGSLTQEYKVIRIFQRYLIDTDPTSTFQPDLNEAEVYTFGTGQWRSLGHVPYWFEFFHGSFLNGHAHCIIRGPNSSEEICAVNFDKETFELFPSPPSEAIEESQIYIRRLGVLKGCLCQFESYDNNWTVWVMKEYGIKKSWHKELVIASNISPNLDFPALRFLHIVGDFEDGTILLMASNGKKLFVYCPRRKTIIDTEIFGGYFNTLTYRPSFHRLHNFVNERVHVF